MDFTPTPEQEMIRKQVREFAEREIGPVAATFDASGEFPKNTVAKMAGLGLLGMLVPTVSSWQPTTHCAPATL